MPFSWTTAELTVSERIGVATETPSTELDVIGSISAINLTLTGNLQLGALSINEFSTDGNLSDNSNLALPTQQAVKTYVDGQITQINNTRAALNGANNQDFAAQNLNVTQNLSVLGNLEVQGDVIARDTQHTSGDVSLGDDDSDLITITGMVKSGHSSGALQVDAALQTTGSVSVGESLSVSNGITTAQLTVTGSLTVDNLTVDGMIRATEGFGLSSGDWEIARNGEDLEIREPEQPGKVWARFKDDTSLHLIGTPHLWVDGNVGIGTTTPTHKFHVKADNAVGLLESTGNQAYLRLSTNEGLNNRVEITNRAGGRLSLWTAGAHDVFNITRNGNVGIRTITPDSALEVNGSVHLDGRVHLGGFTGKDQDEWPKIIWHRDIPNNWDEGLIKHSSRRGFFRRAGYGIHIHKSRDWGIWSSGWRQLLGIQGGSGNLRIRGTLKEGSSRDFKENIKNLTTEEAIATLEELNPIKFNYKADDLHETHLGFIAEDVPELVANHDRKGLSAMDMVAVLTKVVQQQQSLLATLIKEVSCHQK